MQIFYTIFFILVKNIYCLDLKHLIEKISTYNKPSFDPKLCNEIKKYCMQKVQDKTANLDKLMVDLIFNSNILSR